MPRPLALELRHCAQPIRPCLKRVRFLEGTVKSVDVEHQAVRVLLADDVLHELPFDHVVVALGAVTNTKLIPGSEHARTFKTVADALILRNHLIERLERAFVETDPGRSGRNSARGRSAGTAIAPVPAPTHTTLSIRIGDPLSGA